MSSDSDTPRTNAAVIRGTLPFSNTSDVVYGDFARTLERELSALRKESEEAKSKVDGAVVDLDFYRSACANRSEQLAALRKELERAKSRGDHWQARSDTADYEMEQLQKELGRHQSLEVESAMALNKALQERDRLQKELGEAKSKVDGAVVDLDFYKSACANRTAQLAASEARNKELEGVLWDLIPAADRHVAKSANHWGTTERVFDLWDATEKARAALAKKVTE